MTELDRTLAYQPISWEPISGSGCGHNDDQVVCTLTTWERRKCKICGFERWESLGEDKR